MKQLFFGASTLCMLAVAGLMVQSAISSHANATNGFSNENASLLDRVKELELQQIEDSREFLLIDATLIDLDTRYEARQMHMRTQLNELGVPVKPLVGDDIGIAIRRGAAGYRASGRLEVTAGPGGSGWNRKSTGKTSPAGKRK